MTDLREPQVSCPARVLLGLRPESGAKVTHSTVKGARLGAPGLWLQ